MPGPLPPKPITPASAQALKDFVPGINRERSATEVTGGCGCGPERGPEPSREKYWNELTPDEKLERMRMMVRSAISNIGELEAMLSKVRKAFLHHTHDAIGRIHVPLEAEDLRDVPHRSLKRFLDSPKDEDYF